MGCNYYVQYEEETGWVSQVHLGKSSAGWKFLFRGYKNPWHMAGNILSVEDWKEFINKVDGKIFDEYQQPVDDIWKLIDSKQHDGLDHITKAKEDEYYREGDYWRDSNGYDFCNDSFS